MYLIFLLLESQRKPDTYLISSLNIKELKKKEKSLGDPKRGGGGAGGPDPRTSPPGSAPD